MKIISTVSLLALSFNIWAASTQDVIELRDKAKSSDLAYDIVESLTVEVGPRIAGSDGDKKAVAWAEAKFHELGFDNVYKQPVRVRNWSRGRAEASVQSPFPQNLAVTALGGSIATPEGGLTGAIVEFDSLKALTEAKKSDVEGKIVFINKRMKRDKAGRGYGPVVVGRAQGAIEASRLGAEAVIIRSVSTSNARLAHTGAMKYDKDVAKIPAAAVSNPDADLLSAMLKKGKEVMIHLDMDNKEHGWQTSYNVVGELTGREQPNEYVLISAHLDSWDEGTGALDDGAGVGIVMAAAGIIAKQNKRPKRSVRVVLYASEEFGLIGAREYAKENKALLDQIVVAAESDHGAGPIYKFATKFSDKALAHRETLHNVLKPLDITLGDNKARGGPDVSVLPAHGVPVVNLYQDGTYYFDYHHTPNDTLDKINPAELQQNLAAYVAFTFMVADSDMNFRPIPEK